MKPVIVYYPVGTVHMRNLDLLAFAPDKVDKYPYEYVFDVDGRPPPELFDGDVRGLILSIAAVDTTIADLIESAFERDIIVIAIEEVIQLALNQGVINHYLMPVDHLLVASEYERDALLQLGVSPEKVQATGWPFYSKLITHATPEHRLTLQKKFKLPQGKKIAVLCLSALKRPGDPSSLETPAVRRQLLSIVKQGLPDVFHLVIKLHPTEDVDSARKRIAPYFPDATIIAGSTGIDEVLDVADVCLNRGNSQVIIEALLRKIPVLAIPCGIPTLFDDFNDKVVIESSEELEKALKHLYGGERFDYLPIMDTHFPWTPEQALQRTAKAIRGIVDKTNFKRREQDWIDLALYRGFLDESRAGIGLLLSRILSETEQANELTSVIIKLLNGRASLKDLELLLSEMNSPYQKPIILSLWIRQLYHSRHRISAQELAIIERDCAFPPSINPHNYLRYAIMLGDLYLRVGDLESTSQIYSRLKDQYGFFDAVRDLSAKMDLAEGHININKNVMWYLCRKGKRCLTAPFRLLSRLHLQQSQRRKYKRYLTAIYKICGQAISGN
jgi:hypothetical protein